MVRGTKFWVSFTGSSQSWTLGRRLYPQGFFSGKYRLRTWCGFVMMDLNNWWSAVPAYWIIEFIALKFPKLSISYDLSHNFFIHSRICLFKKHNKRRKPYITYVNLVQSNNKPVLFNQLLNSPVCQASIHKLMHSDPIGNFTRRANQ